MRIFLTVCILLFSSACVRGPYTKGGSTESSVGNVKSKMSTPDTPDGNSASVVERKVSRWFFPTEKDNFYDGINTTSANIPDSDIYYETIEEKASNTISGTQRLDSIIKAAASGKVVKIILGVVILAVAGFILWRKPFEHHVLGVTCWGGGIAMIVTESLWVIPVVVGLCVAFFMVHLKSGGILR
jgi:hypothetical protein